MERAALSRRVHGGGAAALRWRHFDPAQEPLGRLTVARSWNHESQAEGTTKTERTRLMPVHPALAKVLAAWKRSGWQRFHGRVPQPDDPAHPQPPRRAPGHPPGAQVLPRGLRRGGPPSAPPALAVLVKLARRFDDDPSIAAALAAVASRRDDEGAPAVQPAPI